MEQRTPLRHVPGTRTSVVHTDGLRYEGTVVSHDDSGITVRGPKGKTLKGPQTRIGIRYKRGAWSRL